MVDRLQERFGVPVWIDSEVHATALGELRAGRGAGRSDLLFLEVGNRISVGLCFDKRLHRGAQGYAGDIGHVAVSDDARAICSCGNTGCLEAVAGSQAIARQAIERVGHGESPMLAEILATGRQITSADVGMAARKGDPLSIELLSRSGRLVGATLATLVNAYNPSLVVVGGGVAQAGDIVLAAIRESVYRHSRSLATRDLQIVRSEMGKTAGLVGIALAVADELFVPSSFAAWMDRGTPIQRAIPRQSGVRHYVGATAAAAPAAAPAPGTRGMIHDETLEVVKERR
jgi:predicted NBD/HSP70 family sugar kinase